MALDSEAANAFAKLADTWRRLGRQLDAQPAVAAPSCPGAAARSLVIHFGFGETGSSALQASLARSDAALRAAGVLYPRDKHVEVARSGVTSGNGTGLVKFLDHDYPPGDEAGFLRAVEDFASGDHAVLLFSSEKVGSRLNPGGLERLQRLAEAAGLEVRFVGYVRHLLEYAFGTYVQRFRAGPYRQSFQDYVADTWRMPFLAPLQLLEEVFGRDALSVRLYDAARADLFGDLTETAAGVRLVESDPVGSVNSSGGRAAARLLAVCNAHGLDRHTAGTVTAALTQLTHGWLSERVFWQVELDILREKAESQLPALNGYVSGPKVGLWADGLRVLPGSEPSPGAAETELIATLLSGFRPAKARPSKAPKALAA